MKQHSGTGSVGGVSGGRGRGGNPGRFPSFSGFGSSSELMGSVLVDLVDLG